MKNIVIVMATTLVLVTAPVAQAAETPTTVGECMKMLNEVGKSISKEKISKVRTKGMEMAEQCKANKFKEALVTYEAIITATK